MLPNTNDFDQMKVSFWKMAALELGMTVYILSSFLCVNFGCHVINVFESREDEERTRLTSKCFQDVRVEGK